MNITVRKACSDDLDIVASLYDDLNDHLATHENYPRWKKGVYPIRKHAEEALASNTLYVAVIDKHIAGTVIYSLEQEKAYETVQWQIPYNMPVITICKLAVHPQFFGCGVGKALLDYADVIGQQQGVKAIRLDTFIDNLPAACLYEKCGFQDMGLVDLGLEEIYGLKWYKVYEKVL